MAVPRLLVPFVLSLSLAVAAGTPAVAQDFQVLVFSKTTGFRHDSIPAGIGLIQDLGAAHGFGVVASEDGGLFTLQGLGAYQAVIFLNTTGDVLNDSQQAAFEAYIRGGGGWVGVHSAADTETAWPFYGLLLGGAWIKSHPAIQPATLMVENTTHPSTQHFPGFFTFTDEWYTFLVNPRGAVQVLLKIDETSYSPGVGAMGDDHPLSWYRSVDAGRAWYTNLGHRAETYGNSLFALHLLGGILWAAGAVAAPPPPPSSQLFTLSPCRLLDTRNPQDGPALTSQVPRLVATVGKCGIPFSARSLVLNVTVVAPTSGGFVTLYPGDQPVPSTSTLNFQAGQTRANSALLLLAPDGAGTLAVLPVLGGGTVHLILDVSGYFE